MRTTVSAFTGILGKAPILCAAVAILFLSFGFVRRPPAAYASTASSIQYKATYIWRTATAFQNESNTLQFLQQHDINLVYLQINIDLPYSAYGKFIRDAGAVGIQVHALGGAPDWVYPNQQLKMYRWIYWVRQYNNSMPDAAKFKGIHLDVEPYTMPAFWSDTDQILGYWKDTVSGFAQEVHTYNPGITVGADLPFWIWRFTTPDGQGGRISISKWMMRELDQTTIMAYRDNAQAILNSAATELSEAKQLGKPALIAVETSDTSNPDISFYSQGSEKMMSALTAIANNLSTNPSYVGYVIHKLRSWRALKP